MNSKKALFFLQDFVEDPSSDISNRLLQWGCTKYASVKDNNGNPMFLFLCDKDNAAKIMFDLYQAKDFHIINNVLSTVNGVSRSWLVVHLDSIMIQKVQNYREVSDNL